MCILVLENRFNEKRLNFILILIFLKIPPTFLTVKTFILRKITVQDLFPSYVGHKSSRFFSVFNSCIRSLKSSIESILNLFIFSNFNIFFSNIIDRHDEKDISVYIKFAFGSISLSKQFGYLFHY